MTERVERDAVRADAGEYDVGRITDRALDTQVARSIRYPDGRPPPVGGELRAQLKTTCSRSRASWPRPSRRRYTSSSPGRGVAARERPSGEPGRLRRLPEGPLLLRPPVRREPARGDRVVRAGLLLQRPPGFDGSTHPWPGVPG